MMTHDEYVSLFQIISEGKVDVEQSELSQMGREMGLTPENSYYLVNLAVEFGKSQVKKEVVKQTENLLYWVNRR